MASSSPLHLQQQQSYQLQPTTENHGALLQDDDPADVHSRSGAIDSSSPPARSWLKEQAWRLSSTFPDASTRVALASVLLLTVIGFVFWLVYIIRDKWMAATSSPASTLSVELQPSLPPLSALFWQFGSIGGALSTWASFQHSVPFVDGAVTWGSFRAPNTTLLLPSQLRCSTVMLLSPTTFCVAPLGADLSAESFTDASSTIEIHLLFFFNITRATLLKPKPADRPFLAPLLSGVMDIGNATTAMELISLAPIDLHTPASAPQLQRYSAILDHSPGVSSFLSNQYEAVNVEFTKTIRLNGAVEWRQRVQSVDRNPLMPSFTDELPAELLARYINDTAMTAKIESMLADPDLELRGFFLSFSPVSFSVTVTTEVLTYNLASFVSDLGGLLSITLIVLHQLFPPRVSTVTRREFVGAKLLRCCKRRETHL